MGVLFIVCIWTDLSVVTKLNGKHRTWSEYLVLQQAITTTPNMFIRNCCICLAFKAYDILHTQHNYVTSQGQVLYLINQAQVGIVPPREVVPRRGEMSSQYPGIPIMINVKWAALQIIFHFYKYAVKTGGRFERAKEMDMPCHGPPKAIVNRPWPIKKNSCFTICIYKRWDRNSPYTWHHPHNFNWHNSIVMNIHFHNLLLDKNKLRICICI